MKKIFGILVLALLLMAGCANPQPPAQNKTTQNETTACNDSSCFISAANECKDIKITVNEDFGVFEYSASNCTFTKTLASLAANETQEMKDALEGKNMTCSYEKGKFDPRLVDSLVFGMEYCHGGLKDALGALTVFS